MIIQYDVSGKIVSIQFDEAKSIIADRPFATLSIDETAENKTTIMAIVQLREEFTIVNNTLQRNGQPVPINEDTDLAQYRNEYQATVTQLQNIENAVNPTNAQVIAAVKFLAKTLRLLLKLLARML